MENENVVTPAATAPAAPAANTTAKPAFRQNNANRKKKKVCQFCVEKVAEIDYQETARLRKLISERAKILPKRVTGTCAKHQRELAIAIKRARTMALLSYVSD